MNAKTLFLMLVALSFQPAWGHEGAEHGQSIAPDSASLNTRLALRDLWVEHVFWVRDYVVANEQGDNKKADRATSEVVANATAIANSLAPLYGQPAADQMLKLLAGHWGAVKHYSDATVEGQADERAAAVDELTFNAQEIAKFLSSANPYLPENTLVTVLSAHGAHHIAQIDELNRLDYAAEAKTWHAMRGHMLVLADTLTAALAKQFPDKF